MTRKQISPLGYLCRWVCGILCLVAIVAVIFHTRPEWLQTILTIYPKSTRTEKRDSPAQLIALIDRRLEQERNRTHKGQELLARVTSLRNSLQTQVDSSKKSIAERRAELLRYAEFINADEDLVLASGEFVSATALRNRAITRRNELAAVTEKLTRTHEFATRVGSTVAELEQLLGRHQQDIAELEELRAGLAEKVNLLAQMEVANSAGYDPSSRPLVSLRESVERMQDVIEVRLEMIEDGLGYDVLGLMQTVDDSDVPSFTVGGSSEFGEGVSR